MKKDKRFEDYTEEAFALNPIGDIDKLALMLMANNLAERIEALEEKLNQLK